jgi:hypothetical protein
VLSGTPKERERSDCDLQDLTQNNEAVGKERAEKDLQGIDETLTGQLLKT